jgi:hypothetical protein
VDFFDGGDYEEEKEKSMGVTGLGKTDRGTDRWRGCKMKALIEQVWVSVYGFVCVSDLHHWSALV